MKKPSLPLITSFMGLILGFIFFLTIETGFFVHWEYLGTTPESPAEFSAFNFNEVYVKANSNKHYMCDILSPRPCWHESELPSESVAVEERSCQDSEINRLYFNKPKSKIINCEYALFVIPGSHFENYYLITENGEIWSWNFFSPSLYDRYIVYLPLSIILGTAGGWSLGSLINDKKSKQISLIRQK